MAKAQLRIGGHEAGSGAGKLLRRAMAHVMRLSAPYRLYRLAHHDIGWAAETVVLSFPNLDESQALKCLMIFDEFNSRIEFKRWQSPGPCKTLSKIN